ncbi:CNGA1 [Symbiodinium sp. CCMP2456]|nr:CNGA1 [Symbiodinium sp. CCMP2456]
MQESLLDTRTTSASACCTPRGYGAVLFVATLLALLAALREDWLVGAGACGATPKLPPQLPRQGPIQAAVFERAQREAFALEASGSTALLSLLRSPALRRYLALFDDGSHLQQLSPEELQVRLKQELRSAELVHNFGSTADPRREGNCGLGVTLEPAKGPDAPYLYEGWMLQALHLIPLDVKNNIYTDAMEQHLFGYPPFADPSCPDVPTAAQRPMYSALNMYRASGGNPQCGPISAILSRKYINGSAVAAPIDTGLFAGFCGLDTKETVAFNGVRCLRCEIWSSSSQRVLGTPDILDHLLPVFLHFYNATQEVAGDSYVEYNLARLLTRLLSRKTYSHALRDLGKSLPEQPLRLNTLENILGYMEVNPLVTIDYPHGVVMLVGLFEALFGTEDGLRLRKWCLKRGWPLAWAHNPDISSWNCGPATVNCMMPSANFSEGIQAANLRLLDPIVLEAVPEGHNLTTEQFFPLSQQAFKSAWAKAATGVPTGLPKPPLPWPPRPRLAEMSRLWSELSQEPSVQQLAVEPVYYQACASADCAGVRILDGKCVCRPL